jgi:hypothetical protein
MKKLTVKVKKDIEKYNIKKGETIVIKIVKFKKDELLYKGISYFGNHKTKLEIVRPTINATGNEIKHIHIEKDGLKIITYDFNVNIFEVFEEIA